VHPGLDISDVIDAPVLCTDEGLLRLLERSLDVFEVDGLLATADRLEEFEEVDFLIE